VALLTLHPRQPRDPVERCYAQFCERMAAAGILREPHETSNHLLSRAERELQGPALQQARHIVALYNTLRYAMEPGSRPEGVRHLRTLVHAFKP